MLIALVIANIIFLLTVIMVTLINGDVSQRTFISSWACAGIIIVISIGFLIFNKKVILISTIALNGAIIFLVWDVLYWPYIIRLPIYLFLINLMIFIIVLMMEDQEKKLAELENIEE